MRKIKFRAKTFYGNEVVYGDLYHDNACLMIRTDDGKVYLDYYIRPSSIAQFVGYDKNGAEIYSDDKVIDLVSGEEIFFKDLPINFSEIGGKFDDLILKK